MQNGPSKFWCNWLTFVIIGIALFSMMLLVLPGVTHEFFNWIAFFGHQPSALNAPEVVGYLSFVYGIIGAVMLGWSLVFLYVVRKPFQAGERWAWYALAVPFTVWFIADSLHSVVSGFWPNAVFNMGFFVLFGIPLLATYTKFKVDETKAIS
ncbi:MAG: hypothetical protein JKY60_01355 [Kordiimonadaceae bacterium]|nr:hypothetical protein [Kordiimonadaceae bacterium]